MRAIPEIPANTDWTILVDCYATDGEVVIYFDRRDYGRTHLKDQRCQRNNGPLKQNCAIVRIL